MNILFINPGNFLKVQGSAEPFYVYNYLKNRHKVRLITTKDHRMKIEGNKDSLVKLIPKIPLLNHTLWFNIVSSLYLAKCIFKEKIDIVYIYKNVFLPYIFFKRFFKTKWIIDFRTHPIKQKIDFKTFSDKYNLFCFFYINIKKTIYKKYLPLFDLVISITLDVSKDLRQSYNIRENKIYIQPLGVDLKLFNSVDNVEINIKENIKLVLVSSIHKIRKFGICIECLDILKKRGKVVSLSIIGEGDYKYINELKIYAKELGVIDQIEFKGFIPHQEIPKELKKAHIALSILPDIECFRVSSPTKVFEYLAMRRVVIASNIKAHRNIIKHRWNGLLYKPEDAEDLADKIEEIVENKLLRSRLIKNSRESIKKFSWDKALSNLEAIVIDAKRT